jgi:ATP-binding cassette, subfamily C, bacterial CydC
MFHFYRKYIFGLQPYRWFTGTILSAAASIAMLGLMAVSGWFIVTCAYVGIQGIQTFVYLFPSALIRGLAIARTVTRYSEKIYNHQTMLDQQRFFRVKLFSSASKIPFLNYKKINSANLSARLMTDIDTLDMLPLQFVIPAAGILLGLAAVLMYLFYIDPVLSLYAFLFCLISLLMLPLIIQYFNRGHKIQLYKLQHKIKEQVYESLEGRMEILHYDMQKSMQQVVTMQTDTSCKVEGKLERSSYLLQCLLLVFFGVFSLVILNMPGGKSAETTALWVAAFFLLLAFGDIAEPVWASIPHLSKTNYAVKRIEAILDEGKNAAVLHVVQNPLQTFAIKNWQASFDAVLFKTMPVSFNIHKGEWLAITGRTGIGKSTLLHSLAGEIPGLSGTMHWNNAVVKELPLAPQCVFISQDAALLSGTLQQNLFNSSVDEISKVLDITGLSQWANQLPNGFETWLGEHGSDLSGGEKRRLLLAQAILLKPDLLLLDEPTAGVDKSLTTSMLKKMKDSFPDLTVIVATHDIAVLRYCNTELNMKECI